VVRISPAVEGWEETREGALTVRGVGALTVAQRAALEQGWSEAQRRFPRGRAMAVEIVFAPTTEVFRQLTTQPGWALASTSGSSIVLQPEAILRARGRDEQGTLLHEMLHVLVEAEASERAPLWLREGLVEVLASGPSVGKMFGSSMAPAAIDGALVHAGTLGESERAHIAAAARVQGLIGRYGLSTVRGWLSSGVPAGVE